ncbi:cation:H+ antiporter [Parvibaculum sp. MBR-TMA-1.3b-4.2]|jgi:cation:H+ antiporter
MFWPRPRGATVGDRLFIELGLFPNILIFAAAALVIGLAGIALTRRADVLADRTGLGEAIVGAVLLGIATSLSGTVTSVVSAFEGAVSLSTSNALGGIAVQTAFLAVADIFYRRANLEHAAADATNLVQVALLILMLSVPLVAWSAPDVTVWAIHPASILLFAIYLGGLRLSETVRHRPMWKPEQTPETRTDRPEAESENAPSTAMLAFQLSLLIAAVGVAGWLIAETARALSTQTGMSQAIMGTLFTSVATSLPELVTTVAAVRRGALQLAVGGIVGGNTYDVLFLAFSDTAYRDGSLYHAMDERQIFLVATGLVVSALLLLGLLRREKRGIGNIGFEGILILTVYAGAVAVQIAQG